jgi:hypothetical protein
MRLYDFQVLTDPVNLKEYWTLIADGVPTMVTLSVSGVERLFLDGANVVTDPRILDDLLTQAKAARMHTAEDREGIAAAWARRAC